MNSEFYIGGKKYISARRASKLTGYATDYIGQLARAGKLDSRMIGRSWFVEENSLLGYKLAVIDTSFVGIRGRKKNQKGVSKKTTVHADVHADLGSSRTDRFGNPEPAPGKRASLALPWNKIPSDLAFVPTVAAAAAKSITKKVAALPSVIKPIFGDAKRFGASVEAAAAPYAVSSSLYIKPEMIRAAGSLLLSSALAVVFLVSLMNMSALRGLPGALNVLYVSIESGAIGVGDSIADTQMATHGMLEKSPLYFSAGARTIANRFELPKFSPPRQVASVASSEFFLMRFIRNTISRFDMMALAVYQSVNKTLTGSIKIDMTIRQLASNAEEPNSSDAQTSRGLVVVPSTGDKKSDSDIVSYIENSFSDEVEVVSSDKDGSSGIIRPVFRDSKGDEYIYVLVPVGDGG